MNSFFAHLICSACGKIHSKDELQNICRECTKPLLAAYHFQKKPDKSFLRDRPKSMWRYRELLPVEKDENIISLGEGFTPLLDAGSLGGKLGLKNLFVKDESLNPTGSFKARGLGMAVSKAKEYGVQKCAIPTAGNAGGAMAAYCAKAGIEAHVFMPENTPAVFKKECEYFGARLTLVKGLISDCGKIVEQKKEQEGWFDVSTLKEPYRIEGKKTMGYEIAEQMDWQLPDVIIYPTGGGTGLIGMWKALDEMEQLGWIGSKRPRMIAVQSATCAPVVKAFEEGKMHVEFFNDARTIANGLCVPKPYGDVLILEVIRKSNGVAVSVSDDEIIKGVKDLASNEGIFAAPEGGAVVAALKKLIKIKIISPDEKIVLLNTGSGYKYVDNFPPL